MKKKQRLEARQIAKIAKTIQKENFAGIKLDKTQRNELKELVTENYASLTKFDMQMQALIPKDKAKDVRKGYTVAKKKGNSAADAMMIGMESAGIAESLQDQVLELRDEKDLIMEEIVASVSDMLNDEQKKMLMAKANEKEEMMDKKSEAEGKKMDSAMK